MILLPVLWEDVEVFLGEYRFEPPDIIEQSERCSLCLQGTMGSLCEFLGGYRGSTYVFHSRLREDSCYKESVPLLIFNLASPDGGLLLLQVFHVLQRGSRSADVEGSSLHSLLRHLFLPYHMVFFASRRASVHLYFSSLPIDLWVMVLEPDVTKDHTLPSEAGDSEECPFGVGFVMEDYIHHFRDLTSLIGETVHVVYQYGAKDALDTNIFCTNKILIYEVARSSGV